MKQSSRVYLTFHFNSALVKNWNLKAFMQKMEIQYIQVVIDYHACVEYLAKYASKGDPRSPVLKQAFNSTMRTCNNNNRRQCIIGMSLKLVRPSFNVVPISLDGSRRINTNSFDGCLVTNDSQLDVYANRQKYADSTIPDRVVLNFIAFASKYRIVNKKLSGKPQNSILRVFPVFPRFRRNIY